MSPRTLSTVLAVALAACANRPVQTFEPPAPTNPGQAHCASALANVVRFEGISQPPVSAITLCERYYGQVTDPVAIQALVCMAGAQDESIWQACRVAVPVPPLPIEPIPVLAVRLRPPSDAGVLGALNPDVVGGIGGLIGAAGEPIPFGQLPGGIATRPGTGASSGAPIILGALDKNVIDRVIHENVGAVKACYEQGLMRGPSLAGKVVVKFVIAKDGSVSSAVMKSSNLGDAEVEACISQALMGLSFPAPAGGGIVIVSYPFMFQPG